MIFTFFGFVVVNSEAGFPSCAEAEERPRVAMASRSARMRGMVEWRKGIGVQRVRMAFPIRCAAQST